jgi:hypothetical protein
MLPYSNLALNLTKITGILHEDLHAFLHVAMTGSGIPK